MNNKTKTKGILKKSVVSNDKTGITWDEEGITLALKLIFREYDKERGQHQKISEPKTPYAHDYSSGSEDEIQMGEGFKTQNNPDKMEIETNPTKRPSISELNELLDAEKKKYHVDNENDDEKESEESKKKSYPIP